MIELHIARVTISDVNFAKPWVLLWSPSLMYCWERDEYVANATYVQIEQWAIRRSAAVVVPFLSDDAGGLGLPVKATVTPPKQPPIAKRPLKRHSKAHAYALHLLQRS